MSLKLIDSHCHLNASDFSEKKAEIVADAAASGIAEMIIPGVTADLWPTLHELCKTFPGLYYAPGLHPLFCHKENDIKLLATALSSKKAVAIGEIGLDFYEKTVDPKKQQRLFETQLELAEATRLPLLLHVRKAHDQVLATLRRTRFSRGGIVHAFAGSLQQALQYHKLGFCLGAGPTITYSRATRIRRVISEVPLESLVVETDAPYMPLLGKEIGHPQDLVRVVEELAKLRGLDLLEAADLTTGNCHRCLGLAARR